MRVLTLFCSLFLISTVAQAQHEISINASAEVLVPADNIAFQINLNAEGDTPQETYELHKEREKVLIKQLKKHNVKDEDLNFEPISINKSYNGSYQNEKNKRIRTHQRVTLTLDNFDVYEQIQITLIEHDFDEFSGNFMSSDAKQGKDNALKKALKIAREKADIIAKETGVTISGIKNISFSYSSRPPRPMMEMTASKSSDSLMEFDQSVSVSANVSVTYKFEE
jgi:uncharacterized protein YggE